MTSRTRAVLDALQKVEDSVIEGDDRIERAVQILEESNSEHAAAVRESFNNHIQATEYAAHSVKDGLTILAKGVSSSGESIRDGLIVSSVLFVGAQALSALFKLARERAVANKQFVEMFDSVVCLFERNGLSLTYKFVLDRSYAEGTTKEERRSLLNGLIHYGVIEDNHEGKKNMLYLNPSSPHIAEMYCRLEEQGLIIFPE